MIVSGWPWPDTASPRCTVMWLSLIINKSGRQSTTSSSTATSTTAEVGQSPGYVSSSHLALPPSQPTSATGEGPHCWLIKSARQAQGDTTLKSKKGTAQNSTRNMVTDAAAWLSRGHCCTVMIMVSFFQAKAPQAWSLNASAWSPGLLHLPIPHNALEQYTRGCTECAAPSLPGHPANTRQAISDTP